MKLPYFCFSVFVSTFIMPTSVMAGLLTVQVNNIKDGGEMHLAIYDDADVFEKDRGDKGGAADGIIDGVIGNVQSGTVTYRFDLPDGTYAIGIFVDANDNNKMDKNFLGIPKEQYGFSNNAKARFGPPSFDDASFTLAGHQMLSIDLR